MDRYAGRRRGRRNLTDPQRELADRLAVRAEALRAEAGREGSEGLSLTDAVALAAVQLGLAPPAPGG
ncbi:hypothetical protein M4914_23490 [Streptomyces somaliensis DSM 40738]|uniref:hypothetical protein n=1 Tax=Streptomyces somaliensis TaxID=78355 RepID=UPI0021C296DA|nr:hypothetical protein [Streptomyces somaliensis]MCQ0025608.1 hypothetical protein [Streptomyces somaliensis DSM 40738]